MTDIPEHTVAKTLGVPGCQLIWRRYLDPIMNALMDPNTPAEDKPLLKAVARAYANAISVIPNAESADKIVKRALTRWKIREGQIPWESTPGYGFCDAANDDPTEQGRIGMFDPGQHSSQREPETSAIVCGPKRAPRKAAPPKPAQSKPVTTALTDDMRTKVGTMLAMGMPVAALTQRFNLTIEQVQSCKNPG